MENCSTIENDKGPILIRRRYGLPLKDKLVYSVGHVLNDLCASMWFSYLLLFFHSILKIPDVYSGLLLLIGQVADGLSTVFVGLESDRGCVTKFFSKYGKRKSWHLIGTICVATTFPFIFMDIIGQSSPVSPVVRLFYFSMFIIIFQFGWASTQISHLSLIPDLTECTNERTELNAYRYAWTVLSNLIVFTITWIVISSNSTSGEDSICHSHATQFRTIVLIVVSIGVGFSLIYHFFLKEKKFDNCRLSVEIQVSEHVNTVSKTWTCWLKEITFYKIGLLYMSTRLFTNISITYLVLYCQETLKLPSASVAYIPLLSYGSGFVFSLIVKFTTPIIGKKITFFIGCIFGLAASLWFKFGEDELFSKYLICVASGMLGIGSSIMLVTALGLVNDMIGSDTKSSAFVFGAMSFLDKLANGGAIMAIQGLHPCLNPCLLSAIYYRDIMGYACGAVVVLNIIAIALLIPTKFDAVVLSNKNSGSKNNSSKNSSLEPSTSGSINSIHIPD